MPSLVHSLRQLVEQQGLALAQTHVSAYLADKVALDSCTPIAFCLRLDTLHEEALGEIFSSRRRASATETIPRGSNLTYLGNLNHTLVQKPGRVARFKVRAAPAPRIGRGYIMEAGKQVGRSTRWNSRPLTEFRRVGRTMCTCLRHERGDLTQDPGLRRRPPRARNTGSIYPRPQGMTDPSDSSRIGQMLACK